MRRGRRVQTVGFGQMSVTEHWVVPRKPNPPDPTSEDAHPPNWIEPQLTRPVEEVPEGPDWLHEIKYDGYRMHGRLDRGKAQLLTRTGFDWSRRYQFTIGALRSLPVKTAYLDGELCAVGPDGVPSFSRLQGAMDEGRTDALVFFVFDLLYVDGASIAALPLFERAERLKAMAWRWRSRTTRQQPPRASLLLH
jgi:bifunctional non-homologous end joining protein LigD